MAASSSAHFTATAVALQAVLAEGYLLTEAAVGTLTRWQRHRLQRALDAFITVMMMGRMAPRPVQPPTPPLKRRHGIHRLGPPISRHRQPSLSSAGGSPRLGPCRAHRQLPGGDMLPSAAPHHRQLCLPLPDTTGAAPTSAPSTTAAGTAGGGPMSTSSPGEAPAEDWSA